jgi:hypothetical protein
MQVRDLIELLSELPQEAEILVDAYESGFTEPKLGSCKADFLGPAPSPMHQEPKFGEWERTSFTPPGQPHTRVYVLHR